MIKKLIWTAAFGLSFTSPALTLNEALELARQNSPRLKAARMDTQAAEKTLAASGRWKNPKIEFEAEGVGGDLNGVDDAEYTVGISQIFQRGGKQKKERAVAFKFLEASSQALLEKKLLLTAAVQQAFIEVMAQQETSVVRSEQVQLAQAFVEVARRRYEAGSNSELDVIQAEVALGETLLLQTCCWGDLQAAQEILASKIGLPVQELPVLEGSYYRLANLDGLAVANDYPGLQRLKAEAERIRNAALLAQAQDTPNVSLGAGYRYEAAGDINTLVFSASMPLSFNKRGRAEHAAGVLRADAVLAGRDEFRRQLEQELASLLALYNGSKMKVSLSENNLIPTAKQAYEVSRKGYEMGRFSWLELISAQQNLAEIRVNYIEYLRDAHVIHAQLSKFIKEEI